MLNLFFIAWIRDQECYVVLCNNRNAELNRVNPAIIVYTLTPHITLTPMYALPPLITLTPMYSAQGAYWVQRQSFCKVNFLPLSPLKKQDSYKIF